MNSGRYPWEDCRANDWLALLTKQLQIFYPKEAYYSKMALYGLALRDGIVTEDIYNSAEKYYGKFWDLTI